MHEVSIADALLHQAAAAARQHGLATVEAVGVRVGRHSGVVGDALAQAFEILREGTTLDRARLTITEVDGTDLALEWIEGETDAYRGRRARTQG
jgi:hydrogenase nickel incorporation protein HypA/HybF